MKTIFLTVLCAVGSSLCMDPAVTVSITKKPHQNLIIYKVTATKKIYHCTVCESDNSGQANWQHHTKSKIHCENAGIPFKPKFKCSLCGLATQRRDQLKRHLKGAKHHFAVENCKELNEAAQTLVALQHYC